MSSASIRVRVELRVHGLGGRLGDALREALAPDDSTAPSWMSIEERVEEDDLVIVVDARIPGERLGSIRNTVDEILEFLYATLRALEAAEPGRRGERT